MACPSELFPFSCRIFFSGVGWCQVYILMPLLFSDIILSLLFSDCGPVDCSSVDSVLMASCSSRAISLSLTSTVLFEFFGWLNGVFLPLHLMKIAGTICDVLVGQKRTGSHKSKSVTAGSLISVLALVSQEFSRVLGVLRCENVLNDTFRFGLLAWIARFTVWTARSAIPFALYGRWMTPFFNPQWFTPLF